MLQLFASLLPLVFTLIASIFSSVCPNLDKVTLFL
jgi:hypothetical protein